MALVHGPTEFRVVACFDVHTFPDSEVQAPDVWCGCEGSRADAEQNDFAARRQPPQTPRTTSPD